MRSPFRIPLLVAGLVTTAACLDARGLPRAESSGEASAGPCEHADMVVDSADDHPCVCAAVGVCTDLCESSGSTGCVALAKVRQHSSFVTTGFDVYWLETEANGRGRVLHTNIADHNVDVLLDALDEPYDLRANYGALALRQGKATNTRSVTAATYDSGDPPMLLGKMTLDLSQYARVGVGQLYRDALYYTVTLAEPSEPRNPEEALAQYTLTSHSAEMTPPEPAALFPLGIANQSGTPPRLLVEDDVAYMASDTRELTLLDLRTYEYTKLRTAQPLAALRAVVDDVELIAEALDELKGDRALVRTDLLSGEFEMIAPSVLTSAASENDLYWATDAGQGLIELYHLQLGAQAEPTLVGRLPKKLGPLALLAVYSGIAWVQADEARLYFADINQ